MKHTETQPFLKSTDDCRCKHVQYIFPSFSSIFRMHNTSIWSVVNLLHRKPHWWSSKIYPLLRFSWMQPENQYCLCLKLLFKNSDFNQSPWVAALEHFSTDSPYLPLSDKHDNHSNGSIYWLVNAMVLLLCVVKEPSHQKPSILDYTALKNSKLE